jgi:hypothetical protein
VLETAFVMCGQTTVWTIICLGDKRGDCAEAVGEDDGPNECSSDGKPRRTRTFQSKEQKKKFA